MTLRERFDAIDRTATAIENVVFVYSPVPDLLTPDEREADEQAANVRVEAEVPGYSDTLPSLLAAA
ncbi:hypothetical protein ADK60_38455 [Streptomyces sp. XY431]|uniref:hypothetical protein n=1 Tax=Streptomyces sp. XY431 TaxID=1415562 RepID=UPI0006AE9A2C|nr:hypothetical protein [Streptomyces sp. XY431]KOV10139.1 hypothetical protein ADK60_38455 [Streptomyces sp. XY431]